MNRAQPEEAKSSIETKLKQIVMEVFCLKSQEITPQMRFADYDGSMESVEMIVACEIEFGIEISDPEVEAIGTFQEMVQFLEGKVKPPEEVLLRGSQAPSACIEQLLRPASSREMPAEELLRSVVRMVDGEDQARR